MAEQSAAMTEFTARVRANKLEMQRCEECGIFAWPPREVCASCWSDRLFWTKIEPKGEIIAATSLHASLDEFFRARLPWRVALVRFAAGPVGYAHLAFDAPEKGAARIHAVIDHQGRGVLIAVPDRECAAPDFTALVKANERRNP